MFNLMGRMFSISFRKQRALRERKRKVLVHFNEEVRIEVSLLSREILPDVSSHRRVYSLFVQVQQCQTARHSAESDVQT